MKKLLHAAAMIFLNGCWILAQSAAFISPKANEAWPSNAQRSIQWSHSGKEAVRLLLLAPGGAKAGAIKSKLQLADGQFPWTVGKLEDGQQVPPAKGYRIALKVIGSAADLAKSEPFEIAAAAAPPGKPPVIMIPGDPGLRTNPNPLSPILRVSKPADGTTVEPGGECPIRWTLVGGGYSAVKIMFYPSGQPLLARSGQVSWIAQNTPNDGAFSWKLAATERTGKYVVRVQTLDDKVFGDSSEITIGTPALPIVKHVAPVIPNQPPKSATLSIQGIDFDMEEPGLVSQVRVKALVNATTGFVLSPALGHPQYGSLYLRCVIEIPSIQATGACTALAIADGVHSLKGTGFFWLGVDPTRFTQGASSFTASFAPHAKAQALGQEAVRKMPGGQFCKKQYFPKLTVTLHLATQGGEAVAGKSVYLFYNTQLSPLKAIVLPGEVNLCLEGIQKW